MVQLNRSMMERYEIADRRPHILRAAIFGADSMMLGAAARLLDMANEAGGDAGAACICRAAPALAAQDGMFTLLVRGDGEKGGSIREERVVQSILRALDPETEFDDIIALARNAEIEMIFLSAACDPVDLLLAARFLYARFEAGLAALAVILPGEHPGGDCAGDTRRAMCSFARPWSRSDAFAAWLEEAPFRSMLVEGLCGRLGEAETAKARRDMNYTDDFIAWAEPMLSCTPDGDVPACLRPVCAKGDFAQACRRKARIFDALAFLCASVGFLCGKDNFAAVFKDEKLRDWIGHAFFDEIMPCLPWERADIAPAVISAFGRLENSMNDMPLLEIGRGLLKRFPETILPAIRAWADREFESPRRLSLSLAAAIMLYAGVRRDASGVWQVARGDSSFAVHDDPEILEAFSRLAHDMPAESLAYAVLADRALWGMDLREIDGLEMRVCFDLSSIQRNGLRQTLRLQEEA